MGFVSLSDYPLTTALNLRVLIACCPGPCQCRLCLGPCGEGSHDNAGNPATASQGSAYLTGYRIGIGRIGEAADLDQD